MQPNELWCEVYLRAFLRMVDEPAKEADKAVKEYLDRFPELKTDVRFEPDFDIEERN